jgi:DNA (cytosine-5)-methyltransferase 1
MDKCGNADDCISTSEPSAGAASLSDEKVKKLPVPGEVEFINGGPPCQVSSFTYISGNVSCLIFRAAA